VTATPTWKRVAEDICRRISAGETPVGSKLPSQQQLATRHKASVGTVKHALGHLTSAGVLEGVSGSGVFVKRSPTEADLAPAPSAEDRLADVERELAEHREFLRGLGMLPKD
jgi:GntR family transcriptional regulator